MTDDDGAYQRALDEVKALRDRVADLQARVTDRDEYARLSGAGYAQTKLDREAADAAELERLGPTFSRQQLRDPAFFAANKDAITEAARRGRVIDENGTPTSGPAVPTPAQKAARDAIRAKMRQEGWIK